MHYQDQIQQTVSMQLAKQLTVGSVIRTQSLQLSSVGDNSSKFKDALKEALIIISVRYKLLTDGLYVIPETGGLGFQGWKCTVTTITCTSDSGL